jgi:hypothetical protein
MHFGKNHRMRILQDIILVHEIFSVKVALQGFGEDYICAIEKPTGGTTDLSFNYPIIEEYGASRHCYF